VPEAEDLSEDNDESLMKETPPMTKEDEPQRAIDLSRQEELAKWDGLDEAF
jgi:hypothetical protein